MLLSGRVFAGSLKGFGGGWVGLPSNPFAERIEKLVRKIGPPLIKECLGDSYISDSDVKCNVLN